MRLLVIEAVSSGLLREYSSSILSEGLSMLLAIANDLSKLGHEVSIVLSNEILKYYIPITTQNIHIIKVDNLSIKAIAKILQDYDGVHIIAPESDNILYNILHSIEDKCVCLNSEAKVIKLISNKVYTLKTLERIGLNVPLTIEIKSTNDVFSEEVKSLNFPLVIKPVVSVGCEDLRIIRSRDQLLQATQKLLSKHNSVLIQEFVYGTPASISIVTDGKKYIPLSINRQFIKFRRVGYYGGYTPIKSIKLKNFQWLSKIPKVFRGLKGYFGIDIVISDGKPYIMEINPRLTVSYAGVGKILSVNPAKLILDSALGRLREVKINYRGVCYFRKVRFCGDIVKLYHKITSHKGILAPPIPVEKSCEAYGFIYGLARNFRGAVSSFKAVVNNIHKLNIKIYE